MSAGMIHDYPVTATEIKDTSFLDIDQDLGSGTWESQKVQGSLLKALMLSENIEQILLGDMQTLALAGDLVSLKTYLVDDGSTLYMVMAAGGVGNQIYQYAIDVTTGLFGTFDLVSGVFTALPIPTLSEVLTAGNTSGANDIEFDATQGLLFANTSRLREGTIDAGLGGNKGVSQVCSLDYELKWEAGRQYVMQQDGTGIRQSLYNFTTIPTTDEDTTKGYAIGSLWTLDDGTTYECTDDTIGSAVWVNRGNAFIVEIAFANLAALESAGTLSLTTLYIITDATPYKLMCKAETVSQLSKTATVVDSVYSGTVNYDLQGNTMTVVALSDNGLEPNQYFGVAPIALLTPSSYGNIFYINSDVSLGDNCSYNIFEQKSNGNILGDNCACNTFKQYANSFTFGDDLVYLTIEAGVTGNDYTATPDYDFLYGNSYASTIFTDGTDNYHRYYDPANDRIVLRNLSTPLAAPTYIGGGGATPDLQQVLDEGSISTTNFRIDDGVGNYVRVGTTSILTEDASGNSSSIFADSFTIQNPSFGAGTIKATTLANNVFFELPNKAAGTETFAMMSDITAGSGDMLKSTYDINNDGIVDSAQAMVTQGRNSTGATLYKGTIVYISGATGQMPNFVKAQANSEATSAGTFGVVNADISNNSNGWVTTIGLLDNIDTRTTATHPFTDVTLAIGDTIYLHPTVAGYITNVKPYAPYHLVYVGKVVNVGPSTQGAIVYRIQNGYELDELHDVSAQTPSNKNGLFYNTSTSLWEARAVAATDIDANVSNVEFGYLDGVTSSIQTQINGKISATSTDTLTNKRITTRSGTVASSPTPTINTDNVDFYSLTAQAADITSFTTNLSGTPTIGQTLWISIKDNGTARAITWGASFESSTIALPTTTVISTRLDVAFIWNEATSVWRCVGVA